MVNESNKEVERQKRVTARLRVASDEAADYEYPKREDEWPSLDKQRSNTPVGRQAADARSIDRYIYKERREPPESRRIPAPSPTDDEEFIWGDITREKLTRWREHMDKAQRGRPQSNLPIKNAARRRLKQR